MTIFYVLILWIGTVSLLTMNIKHKKARNKIVVFLGCFGVFLIQALRAENVGIDLSGYLPGYEMADSINVFAGERLFNYEVGYILYSQVISKMNFSNQWFLAVVALTIIAPIGYTWIKCSKMPGLSAFIYITLIFFTFSFSGLRQSIAMAIVFFSFRFIQEKSLIKFIFCVVIAMSFHTTAIIFIFAYPLYYLKLKPIYYTFIIPMFILFFLLKAKIYLLIYRLFRGVEGEVEVTNSYTMLFVMILVLFLAHIFGSKDSKTINAYKNYMLVAILVQILASQSSVIMRAGYYYLIFITLLIPEVIKNQLDARVRMLVTSVLVFALIYFFQKVTGSGYLNVNPYSFYWE